MPYDGELAKHGVLIDFAENPLIKEMLEACHTKLPNVESMPANLIEITRQNWQPGQVFAIDGSQRTIPIERSYPGASVGFISVATVMIDMEKLRKESEADSINPVSFAEVEKPFANTGSLPISNVVRKGQPDARSSFRFELNKLLKETYPIEGGESLLETYKAILQNKEPLDRLSCPLGRELCPHDNLPVPNFSSGRCNCAKYPIYATDQLRIHERFYDNSPNGESLGETRALMEHLTLLNYLRYLEKKELWEAFRDTGFILDGPLAIFGHAAWLSERVKLELQRLNARVQEKIGMDMLILGIEKSGQFYDHWLHFDEERGRPVVPRRSDVTVPDAFDEQEEPSADEVDPLERMRGRIKPGQVLLLDNTYIRQNIARGDEKTIHGVSTYYGRPFLYKTTTSAMIVGMIPMLTPDSENRLVARPDQYHRLSDGLDLLDSLISMRYPNAILPLMAAHAHAAIPVQMGDKMFDQLVRQHLGQAR